MTKLVNLGSMCIDNVYRVPNISASGETVASTDHEIFPGGKGLNQSLAAAKAGAAVVHVGCVGADGAWLVETLASAGVEVSGVREVEGASGHAVIQVDAQGRNAIVIAGGANRTLGEADIQRAVDLLEPGDWLLLQNEINDLEKVLARASGVGAQVAFNIAPVDGRESNYDLAQVAMLIVNQVEAAALLRRTDPDAALDSLCAQYPHLQVVLTLGADGLRYGWGDQRLELGAFEVTAVDETAAGDAFVGYLMWAMLAGKPIHEALRIASAAGALAVTRRGAASSVPDQAEVLALL